MYPTEASGDFSYSKFLKFRSRIWICLEREGTYTHFFSFLFSSPFVFMNSRLFLLPPKLVMIVEDN